MLETAQLEVPRASRPRWLDGRAATVAAALVLTLLTWPVRTLAPTNDIDVSWMGGLHLAARNGLHFGSGVTFTFGPLGFLTAPQLWFRSTAVLAVAYDVAVQAGFLGMLLVLLRPLMPLPLAFAAAYVATRVLVRPPSEMLALTMLLTCLVLVQRARLDRGRVWWGVGVAVTALELLTKFSDGLYCLALLAITVAALSPRARVRAAVSAVAAAVLLGVVVWVGIGQRLTDLPDWVRASLQLTSGYSAMAAEDPGRDREYVEAILLLAGLGGLLALGRHIPSKRFVAGLLLVAVFIEFEHGFVRHNRHVLGFFAFLIVVPLALSLRPPLRRWQLGLAGLAVVANVLATQSAAGIYLHASLVSPGSAVRQVRVLVSAHKSRTLQEQAARGLRRHYGLDAATLTALAGHRVQIDPYDTSVAWAYGLQWAPVPVFQTYAAYTPWLDARNAEALTSATGPDRVLRARHGSIDGRYVPFESPEYTFAELCGFRQVSLTATWQVLARSPNRCGVVRPLSSATVGPGVDVRVPTPSTPDRAVFARLHLTPSLADRLATRAFKPLADTTIVLDGTRWRLVAANAGGPLLLHVPSSAPAGPGTQTQLDTHVLRLSSPGLTRIDFYDVPLTP